MNIDERFHYLLQEPASSSQSVSTITPANASTSQSKRGATYDDEQANRDAKRRHRIEVIGACLHAEGDVSHQGSSNVDPLEHMDANMELSEVDTQNFIDHLPSYGRVHDLINII